MRQSGRSGQARSPRLERAIGLDVRTTLERVEPHRLAALVVEEVHPTRQQLASTAASELAQRTVQRSLKRLINRASTACTNSRSGQARANVVHRTTKKRRRAR